MHSCAGAVAAVTEFEGHLAPQESKSTAHVEAPGQAVITSAAIPISAESASESDTLGDTVCVV